MKAKKVLGILVMMFVFIQTANAGERENFQKYFNDTALKVKATTDPVQKRDILIKSLQVMSIALEKVDHSGLVSEDERAGFDRFKATLQDKLDELTGSNGFERVADAQLNAFSDYVVQDMEQAERQVTISLVSALLIVIILILLL
jgi:hypothetical protein